MPDSPAQSTNLQGQTLANARFHIVNLLGSGGMADVYRAFDNRTKRDVAVKMPKLNLLADEEFVQRFDREIKIMIDLKHPHIVPVLFAGKHEGHTFAVFPYLTGGNLGDLIKRDNRCAKPPTTSADLFWLTQIASALDHLHGQGLLHRDVKPDNILFDAEGKAYLSDFGIVRALATEEGDTVLTQLTAADMTIGTASYMALELLLANTPYTGAVDQYALAVTLYESLTGRKPYDGSAKQIVFDQAQRQPQPLAELRHDLPAPVSDAVHRALSKEAEDRFTNCIEFAQAVVGSWSTRTAQTTLEPIPINLGSSAETVVAPTQQDATSGRAAGVSRRSTLPVSPVSPAQRAPFSPPANADGSPRPWWIIGISTAALLAITLLIISSSRPAKRDALVKNNTNNPPTPKLEKYLTNSIGMKLVLIPAGRFMMGSPETEKERYKDEGPQHEVHITKPFYMGVYEVTQAQYQRVMGVNPSWFSSSGSGKEEVAGMDTINFPVEQVSRYDAVEFCKKLSEMPKERAAGRVYRLPSEAEWEYTCRGGAATYQVFHYGNTLSAGQANCSSDYPANNKLANYLGRTTTVGSYQPNAFGVYDMHGNVWEWCDDLYDSEYYAKSPSRDPKCLTIGLFQVIRGGSWNFFGGACRAADRLGSMPALRSSDLGFRAALVPSGQ